MYSEEDHSFVICAYGESPFLEACICSLKKQTLKSKIRIATSTPNELIKSVSEKYQIPLWISGQKPEIARDWNYAYGRCETKLVTLAHQDDIYEPWYLEQILKTLTDRKKPLIIFTDYGELREERKIDRNQLLGIKRILLFPLRCRWLQRSRWVRRRVLSFGSAISCPTVTYVKDNLPKVVFREGYRSNLDWQAWERLSRLKGEFVYCNKICIYHRIYGDSTTSSIIADHGRSKEDFEMFCRFWPVPIAKLISKWYRLGEKSNNL